MSDNQGKLHIKQILLTEQHKFDKVSGISCILCICSNKQFFSSLYLLETAIKIKYVLL